MSGSVLAAACCCGGGGPVEPDPDPILAPCDFFTCTGEDCFDLNATYRITHTGGNASVCLPGGGSQTQVSLGCEAIIGGPGQQGIACPNGDNIVAFADVPTGIPSHPIAKVRTLCDVCPASNPNNPYGFDTAKWLVYVLYQYDCDAAVYGPCSGEPGVTCSQESVPSWWGWFSAPTFIQDGSRCMPAGGYDPRLLFFDLGPSTEAMHCRDPLILQGSDCAPNEFECATAGNGYGFGSVVVERLT